MTGREKIIRVLSEIINLNHHDFIDVEMSIKEQFTSDDKLAVRNLKVIEALKDLKELINS